MRKRDQHFADMEEEAVDVQAQGKVFKIKRNKTTTLDCRIIYIHFGNR